MGGTPQGQAMTNFMQVGVDPPRPSHGKQPTTIAPRGGRSRVGHFCDTNSPNLLICPRRLSSDAEPKVTRLVHTTIGLYGTLMRHRALGPLNRDGADDVDVD